MIFLLHLTNSPDLFDAKILVLKGELFTKIRFYKINEATVNKSAHFLLTNSSKIPTFEDLLMKNRVESSDVYIFCIYDLE